jgi:hypothetical protein
MKKLATFAALLLSTAANAHMVSLTKQDCSNLTGILPPSIFGVKSGEARIFSAVLVPASTMSVAPGGPTPSSRITTANPAYCKVLGEILPLDRTAPMINFQVNMPLQWVGRILQFGGGGFNGVLVNATNLPPAMPFDAQSPLSRGYVTVGTDSGHQNKPNESIMAFASNDEAFLNFAHTSYKKVRDVAYALSNKAYAHKPSRVYFIGSSEGGREALTMAQRYPESFDGVISRVPVIALTMLHHAGGRKGVVTAGDGWFNKDHLETLQKGALDQCDKLDGVEDKLINNYAACAKVFDIDKLKCGATPSNQCLTDAQIKAVKTIRSPYKFPFALANGLTEYPGFGIGGEALPANGPTGGWGAWVTGSKPPEFPAVAGNGISYFYGSGAMAHFHAKKPGLDVRTYKIEEHKEQILKNSALIDSTNPDLSAFSKRGGKVIMLEHMSDYAQNPYMGIAYYNSVVAKMGASRAAQTIRLFTMPNVDHVGFGAPANVDLVQALENWVQKRQVPQNLVALEQEVSLTAKITRSLPLCEYPMYPHYQGKGDITTSDNYKCVK